MIKTKPLKRQWQIFVREMNKHGDHTKAYLTAYPHVKVTSARVKGYNLLQRDTIADKIKKHSDKIDEIATREAAKELKDEIVEEVLTALRKKEILRQIAEGKSVYRELRPFYNKDTEKWESTTVKLCEPSLMERLKAIELHNKMTGDFMPDKVAKTDSKGNDIEDYDLSKLSTDELLQLREINNKCAYER